MIQLLKMDVVNLTKKLENCMLWVVFDQCRGIIRLYCIINSYHSDKEAHIHVYFDDFLAGGY